MTKEDAYRRYAVQCVELALRATSVADRALLRKMAEVWVDLAMTHKQSEQRPKHRGASSSQNEARGSPDSVTLAHWR